MYIHSLGADRVASHTVGNAAPRTTGTSPYTDVMKKALEKQSGTVNTASFAYAGNIIFKEALEKMEADPEWGEAVMEKVRNVTSYQDISDVSDAYANWGTGQSGLRGYLLQNMLSGGYPSYGGLGLSGYSATGLGSLAAASYGNMMNGGYQTSLLGNWML